MVRSMIAGVAGLRAHQSKMDVIGNNIANVNTWGFKSYSYNFKDSMYTNSINSAGGSVLAGATGGRNASQVGYGSQLSSISNVFETGAPSPSSREMDCMIDGTGFFLVGNMVNGSFNSVADSGLYLSRVGIFSVDEQGYLVDDLGSYVYGYAVQEGTGTPETPAAAAKISLQGCPITNFDPPTTDTITIAGQTVTLSGNIKSPSDVEDAIQEWIAYVSNVNNQVANGGTVPDSFANVKISLDTPRAVMSADGTKVDNWLVDLTLEATTTGDDSMANNITPIEADFGGTRDVTKTVNGNTWRPGIPAVYSDQLSTIKIPNDPTTNPKQPYDLQSYSISGDGTVVGVDKLNRAIPIGKVALISVQNPNGLEKTNGYYYTIGENAGDVAHQAPGQQPVGTIKGSYLEMANVDLANEFSNIITTQRGFQANSKIITVTDEMLQELVNMKR